LSTTQQISHNFRHYNLAHYGQNKTQTKGTLQVM